MNIQYVVDLARETEDNAENEMLSSNYYPAKEILKISNSRNSTDFAKEANFEDFTETYFKIVIRLYKDESVSATFW